MAAAAPASSLAVMSLRPRSSASILRSLPLRRLGASSTSAPASRRAGLPSFGGLRCAPSAYPAAPGTAGWVRRFASSQASASDAGSASSCPRCGANPRAEGTDAFPFLCASCGAVQEADYGSATHFQLLGLQARFEVDPDEVDSAYKELQKKLHPDRHANALESDRELVERHAARLNEAVATLRSPLQRAGYWMQLNGVPVLEEDQRIGDMSTMMEVMEISESIAEAESQAEIDKLTSENSVKVAKIEGELQDVFVRKDWDAAKPLVERLQMLTRLGQRLDDWSPRS